MRIYIQAVGCCRPTSTTGEASGATVWLARASLTKADMSFDVGAKEGAVVQARRKAAFRLRLSGVTGTVNKLLGCSFTLRAKPNAIYQNINQSRDHLFTFNTWKDSLAKYLNIKIFFNVVLGKFWEHPMYSRLITRTLNIFMHFAILIWIKTN